MTHATTAIIDLIWSHLSDLTAALRFGSALVSFALTSGTGIRRLRRRIRRARRENS